MEASQQGKSAVTAHNDAKAYNPVSTFTSNPATRMWGAEAMEITQVDGKFTAEDVSNLRTELLQSGLDSWQAAELVSSFLSARGYGISSEGARSAVTRIDALHCNLECMRAELEQLALFV